MTRKIERMDDCYNDSPLWERQDEAAAMSEGWYISNSTEGCDEIQRYPWSEIFPSDAEAIAHVYWKAGTGSDLHRRAIAYTLRDDNSWAYERPLRKYKGTAEDVQAGEMVTTNVEKLIDSWENVGFGATYIKALRQAVSDDKALAQQPAAVDGAMVERALTARAGAWTVRQLFADEDEAPDIMRIALTAALAHATAAKDAEIEALRADRDSFNKQAEHNLSLAERLREEVERLKSMTAVTMGVGSGDGSLFVHGDYDSIKAAQDLVLRADRLAEALHRLEEACDDSDGAQYGTLGTSFVRDVCAAALHPTTIQENT